MILIYTDFIGSRLTYIANLLFQELSGMDVKYTRNKDEFRSHEGPRINYSSGRITDREYWIFPHPLMLEAEVRKQDIQVESRFKLPIFFTSPHGDLGFDVFAASFFLVSRYEEYLPHQKDEYGRFLHTESLAWKNQFLDMPLVQLWTEVLRQEIQALFPGVQWKLPSFKFLPTYDIDIAYAYKGRDWKRSLGGWARSVLSGDWARAQQRVRVMQGKEQDPYDVYEWLYALHLKYSLHPTYFFLMAAEQQGYDKNVPYTHPVMKELIQFHGSGDPVGIHPSWASGDNPSLVSTELLQLEELVGRPIIRSRQHYLRFNLPDTYRLLRELGIEKEYSMGYGAVNGFRASIAAPFYWYDLGKEQATELVVIPFCYMDANSYYELRQTPAQAYESLRRYHDTVKKVNGLFSIIFHNHILGLDPMFRGWREVYELFLSEVVYWDV